MPQALWGALNPDSLLFGGALSIPRALASGRDSAAAALPGAEGCGCATPCPLPALVALLRWLCHQSVPVYVTVSRSQARGALESSLWICNSVLSALTPHLIFHSPSNAVLCQRQRLAGGSATDIYIIRLGLQSLCPVR